MGIIKKIKKVSKYVWDNKKEILLTIGGAAAGAYIAHKATKALDEIEKKDFALTAHDQGVRKGIAYDVYKSRHMPSEMVSEFCKENCMDEEVCNDFREECHDSCTEIKQARRNRA